MKRIIVLGSTGSIGLQTLDLVRSRSDEYSVVAVSAHRQSEALALQAAEFGVVAIALSNPAAPVPTTVRARFFRGAAGLCEMIRETEADIVVNGISGAAGLLPSFAALESSKDLALANKETMVLAGRLAREIAARQHRHIIPVDSEHSAVANLLARLPAGSLAEIILTASGGPFRDRSPAELESVTVAETLRHPTWKMGPKITVDSATMANKALEVIEAARLFDAVPAAIKVVIHPQSFVHALVRTRDGALYAQISKPDMRLPILGALAWPDCPQAEFAALDLAHCTMEFLPVDKERYPLLGLGYQALALDGAYPIVFNAANEEAVGAFIRGEIAFTGIARIVAAALDSPWPNLNRSLDDVIFIDARAREKTRALISQAR